MYVTLALLILFFILPVWGGYTGDNMLLWLLVALALIGTAGACMWLEYRKQEVKSCVYTMQKQKNRAS